MSNSTTNKTMTDLRGHGKNGHAEAQGMIILTTIAAWEDDGDEAVDGDADDDDHDDLRKAKDYARLALVGI
jgi:hypothetical protein